MNSLNIALEPEERKLLEIVELDALALKGHEHWKTNAEHVLKLFTMLVDRGAIPEHRQKYLTDPGFNPGGRGLSVLDQFRRNGCEGDDVVRHPHFLAHLRYLLNGPDLPQSVVDSFQTEAARRDPITSGDVIPLAKLARQLARANGMNSGVDCEEFFKLALEVGMNVDYAAAVRRSVQQLRH